MKKLISLLICVVLILSCFAGCSNAEETNTTPDPGTTDANVTPTGPQDPSAGGTLPLVAEGEKATINIGLMQNANVEDYETNAYTLWLEEQTGINLEFTYFSSNKTECMQQLNSMIAGGEKLPDILWGMTGMSDAARSELGQDGYLLDLTDYFEEYGHWFWEAYNLVNEEDRGRIFQYGKDPATGKLYGWPAYVYETTDVCICGFINTAWLDAVDMDMPETVNDLYEVLKAFKNEDPNGNGKADEIPLLYREGNYRGNITEWIINAWVYCNDAYFFNATDGELWVPYTTNEYREALKYMNKLYEEGLFSTLSWTLTNDAETIALATPSEGEAVTGVVGGHPTLVMDSTSEAVLEYQAIAPLKAETELGGYGSIRSAGFSYKTSITADCKDPVLAFRLLDFMNSQESICRQRYGRMGIDWEYAEEGMLNAYGEQTAVVALDSSVYSTQNNYCWHNVQAVIRPSCLFEQYTPTEGISEMELRVNEINVAIQNNTVAAGTPDELVYTLLYNETENEVVSEVKTPLTDYMKEARALFISGALDPNSDADWQTYLDNMEAQGLSDWLEAAQAAYTRMNAE